MSWQRPLTGLERWCWLIDRAAVFNLVYVARVRGRFDLRRLRLALEVLQYHYPQLASRIADEGTVSFVAAGPPVPVDLRAFADDGWRQAAIDEADTPVPVEEGPAVRCVVLDGDDTSDLILTFHRAAADARSGATIVDELLRLHAGEAQPALPAPEVLQPPTEEIVGSRWAAIVASRKQLRLSRRMRAFRPRQSVPAKHRSTGLADVTLTKETVRDLTGTARAHGTSFHGALCAAVLLSVREELRKEGHPDVFLGCETSVDMRRRTELRPGAVGNLLSHVISGHRIHENTLLWDLAAQVSESLRTSIRSEEVKAFAQARSSAGLRARSGRRLAARTERAARTAAVVNNVGRLEFYERYGALELERLGFLESASPTNGAAICVHAASVAGAATLNFTWAEPLLGADRAGRIVSDIAARLRQAAGA